jgi:short-subunit dehydrogenase
MATQIAIVFGAGKSIGGHSVQTFKSKGFKVASVSRSVEEQELDGVLYIPSDLTQPSLVSGIFEKVRKRWGEPSVIVYNGE